MWGQIGIGGPEKTPYGGKKMSDIMIGLLTAGMRTTTRGSMGDRDFYYALIRIQLITLAISSCKPGNQYGFGT